MNNTLQYYAACRHVLRCKTASAFQKETMQKQAYYPIDEQDALVLSNALLSSISGGLAGAGLGAIVQQLRGKDVVKGLKYGGLLGALTAPIATLSGLRYAPLYSIAPVVRDVYNSGASYPPQVIR